MCGIAGFLLNSSHFDEQTGINIIQKMTDSLAHRGPDDSGLWSDKNDGIYLGHRRLSILDLSVAGRQPMHSYNERFVITFNGEVYNFKELKADLEKNYNVKFTNNTDTQVLLEACNIYGIEKAIKKLIGMYAFSIWDKQNKQLYLIRDRVGKKPLYWGYVGKDIVFSSELKAICLYPQFDKSLNFSSISSFLRYGYINAPESIYNNISKIEPGTYALFMQNKKVSINTYWSLDNTVGKNNPNICNKQEKKEDLELLLKDAVNKRMISDVPVGVMLSGGIDSSLITALMQIGSNKKVKSYTIGFNEKQYDESKFARRIAEYIGTEHYEFHVEADTAIEVLPDLPEIYDEPFADSSQIPTYIVSKLLKNEVTVALSGDGGDEIFAGYSRYFWGGKFAEINRITPSLFRFFISNLIQSIQPYKLDTISTIIPTKYRPSHFGERLHKIAHILRTNSDAEIYSNLISQWDPQSILRQNISTESFNLKVFPGAYDFISAMQYLDFNTYLPDDILVKVDRASMANGLEVRSPLLDHRVIEYAWKIDKGYKIVKGKGKYLLRSLLNKYVPKTLIERPKMGFGVPISTWLRGPLKEWTYDLLSEERLNQQGIFKPEPILNTLDSHMNKRRNYQYPLWTMLMFQSWYDRWFDD